MPRTANDIKFGGGYNFPPIGKYPCTVVSVLNDVSAQKKTPFIDVTFSTGDYEFPDQLYVTDKTLGRLCMFATRVCGMPRETRLPDADTEAVKFLANYIMQNAIGKRAIVIVEENEEKYMPTSGPDAGRTLTKKRKRVAFRGYEEYKEPAGDL